MLGEYSFLYVEDDDLNRDALRVVFTRVMGVQKLAIFHDSADFMARVKALDPRPTVILLDVYVKPHNGFEMLRMLRADPDFQQARIIAITASVMNEQVEQLRASGFDAMIGKPINVGAFPGLIERVIRGEPVWQIT
jgi:CheY-like chemotaxis protein